VGQPSKVKKRMKQATVFPRWLGDEATLIRVVGREGKGIIYDKKTNGNVKEEKGRQKGRMSILSVQVDSAKKPAEKLGIRRNGSWESTTLAEVCIWKRGELS